MTFCILFFKLFHLSSTGAVSLDSWVPIHVPILDHCVCMCVCVCVCSISVTTIPAPSCILPAFGESNISPRKIVPRIDNNSGN